MKRIIFANESARWKEEVAVHLEVGPDDDRMGALQGGPTPIHTRTARALFIFDSGSHVSLISGALATRLGLKLGAEVLPLGSIGGPLNVKGTRFRVLLGRDWVCLPVFVRCSGSGIINPYDQAENLLGLRDLLDRYDIGVSMKRLTLTCLNGDSAPPGVS